MTTQIYRKPILIKRSQKPKRFTNRAGWRQIADKRYYFRSEWEYKYALYLEMLKKSGSIKEWEHEPQTFWFEEVRRGIRSYLPDFKVTDNAQVSTFVEVKGHMDAKSRTKIKRFKKYYPNEQLMIIDEQWFKKNGDKLPWKKD